MSQVLVWVGTARLLQRQKSYWFPIPKVHYCQMHLPLARTKGPSSLNWTLPRPLIATFLPCNMKNMWVRRRNVGSVNETINQWKVNEKRNSHRSDNSLPFALCSLLPTLTCQFLSINNWPMMAVWNKLNPYQVHHRSRSPFQTLPLFNNCRITKRSNTNYIKVS